MSHAMQRGGLRASAAALRESAATPRPSACGVRGRSRRPRAALCALFAGLARMAPTPRAARRVA